MLQEFYRFCEVRGMDVDAPTFVFVLIAYIVLAFFTVYSIVFLAVIPLVVGLTLIFFSGVMFFSFNVLVGFRRHIFSLLVILDVFVICVLLFATFLTSLSGVPVGFTSVLTNRRYGFWEYWSFRGSLVDFSIGIKWDAFSLFFVIMVVSITNLVLIFYRDINTETISYGSVLLLKGSSLLAFCSSDLFTFTIFMELTVIPMWFILRSGLTTSRDWASFYYIIYSFLGGLIVLSSVISLMFGGFSPVFTDLFVNSALGVCGGSYDLYLFIIVLGLLIKVPCVPFHHWLIVTHVEASTSGSILLAAILLKIPAYALIRIVSFTGSCVPFSVSYLLLVWAAISLIFCTARLWLEHDMKRIVALSSIIHMNVFIGLLGVSAGSDFSKLGAACVVLLISHSYSSAAMFAVFGMVSSRYHTKDSMLVTGLYRACPKLAFHMLISILISCALPVGFVFVSELFIFLGVTGVSRFFFLFLSVFVLLLTTARFLVVFIGISSGDVPRSVGIFTDITRGEYLLIMTLNLLLVFFAILSSPILSVVAVSLKAARIRRGALAVKLSHKKMFVLAKRGKKLTRKEALPTEYRVYNIDGKSKVDYDRVVSEYTNVMAGRLSGRIPEFSSTHHDRVEKIQSNRSVAVGKPTGKRS